MPFYAQFDPAAPAPAPVTGWYDTDNFTYPVLPQEAALLALDAGAWAGHFDNPAGWAVDAGALVPYTAPAPAPTLAQQAVAALNAGVAMTWSVSTALDGSYFCDPVTQADVQAELIAILINGAFTDGAPTLAWYDAATPPAPHVFSIAQFKLFATALAGYVTALKLIAATNTGTLPATPLAITG